MSLADYLAKNYLTADSKPDKKSKKRKRKQAEDAAAGLVIAEDDDAGWGNSALNVAADDDENIPYVAGKTSEFRKKKSSGWTRVGTAAPNDAEQAEADRIIAQTLLENRERAQDADDAPVIEGDADDLQAMGEYTASGTKAGLQSSKDVQAAAEKLKREERRLMKEAMEEAGITAGADETIYRDASGRIINVAMKRAEARRKAEEEEQKRRDEAEAARGDAQRVLKKEQAQRLRDAKYMTFARGADDAELNEEMKDVERWNDPAAQFVTTKKQKKSKSGRPLYQGSFQPNRFSIRPGYRWDGVDRSIGFEKKWFEARNKKKDMEDLKYAWEMDE